MGIAVDERELARALALARGSGFVSDGRHPGILLGVRARIAAGGIVSDRHGSRG
jgi:hypothetical protein